MEVLMATKSSPSNISQHTAQFRKQASALSQDVQELGKITKNIAHDTMDIVRENAGGVYQQGVEKAKNLEKSLETQIKEHPLQSLLIAAGLGMVVAWLFRRR